MNTIPRQVGRQLEVPIKEIQGIFQEQEAQTKKKIPNIFQGMEWQQVQEKIRII